MLKNLCASLSMLSFVVVVFAQDPKDDNEAQEQTTKRPSWSAGMPERQKTAELNKPQFKPEPGQAIELDMSEFGLQRKPEIEIDLPVNSDLADVSDDSSEAEQAALEQAASEQAASEQAASEQAALEQAALEQAALEQAALEQAALEQAALEQAALEQAALEQAALEQAALEQAALEQAALEQAALEQAASEQAALEQADPTSEEVGSSQDIQQPVQLSDERSLASVNPPVNIEPQDFAKPVNEPAEYGWEILQRLPLEYPRKAAVTKLEGWVEIEVTINPAGIVESATSKNFSRRGRVFGKPAEESVKKWLFEPPRNIGITTNLTRIYKVEFNL